MDLKKIKLSCRIMHIDIDALVVAVINDHKTRDIARHSLGGGLSPPKLNVSPPNGVCQF